VDAEPADVDLGILDPDAFVLDEVEVEADVVEDGAALAAGPVADGPAEPVADGAALAAGPVADGPVADGPGAEQGQVVIYGTNGKITFYPSDKRFEAVCRVHQIAGDRLCRLTRSGLANPRRSTQGRPLGLMLAWLEDPEHMPLERDEHVKPLHVKTAYAHGLRSLHRGRIAGMLNGTLMLSKERPQRPDEASEPEGVC
jgi:hypothetical protein